jgi:SOS response regulatory protein OraA/RecX
MDEEWIGFAKIRNWCALRERSASDVRRKLRTLKSDLPPSAVLERLRTEDFLNEDRFAEDFARGKLRIKRWGPTKIKLALRAVHGLDEATVKRAIGLLEAEDLAEAIGAALQARQRVRPNDDLGQWTRHLCERGFGYTEASDAVARSTFASPC